MCLAGRFWFSLAGKPFGTKLHYKENFSVGVQARLTKSSIQLVCVVFSPNDIPE